LYILLANIGSTSNESEAQISNAWCHIKIVV
jgi:hypothetical protein